MNHLTLYLLNLLRAFPYSYRTLIRLVISSMPTSLISSFCTPDQMFAAGFLQIPPHDGHPCLVGYTLPAIGRVTDLHRLENVRAGRAKKISVILEKISVIC